MGILGGKRFISGWQTRMTASRLLSRILNRGNYHVAAFFIHSALGRALKAAVVAYRQKVPSKTHNLKGLYSEVADQVGLSQKQVDFLGEITPASQAARYVDVSMVLPREVYSKELVERYFSSAKPILGVLKRGLRG